MDRSHLKEAAGLFDSPVAFVDVETTGCLGASRIIEVGLVAAKGGDLEYEWSTLVNPGVAIPFAIGEFTGITDEMVRHAPFFEDRALRLRVLPPGIPPCGAHILEPRRLHGEAFAAAVSARAAPQPRCAHRASRPRLRAAPPGPDAQALWQFWQTLGRTRDRDEIESALLEITQLGSPHLPPDLADRLPALLWRERCAALRG